jgi:hypothetical protein
MMLRLTFAVWIAGVGSVAADDPWPRHTIDNRSRGADGVRLADVNGDGLADIATGWEEGGVIRVYLNPGPQLAHQPWPMVTVGSVASPEDAVLVDLDQDGAMDVVSCCEGRNRTVYVHWAPTDSTRYLESQAWSTAAIPCTRGRQMWMFALALQLDGRHGPDLVAGSKGDAASIGWLQAASQPRQLSKWRFHRLYDAGWIMSLVSSDMDGDGDLDILASDRKGPSRGILWIENPGPTKIASGADWPIHRLGGDDKEVMFLQLSKSQDRTTGSLFCAVRGAPLICLRGDFTIVSSLAASQIPLPAGCGTGKGVAVGDINRDGRDDVVFTCENARGDLSGVRWLSRQSGTDSRWEPHEISGPRGTKYDRVELLDLDADGDLDVLTCEERENLGVIWYENPLR